MKLAKWLFTKHNFRSYKRKQEMAEIERTASIKMRNMTCQQHLLVNYQPFLWGLLRSYWGPSAWLGVTSPQAVARYRGKRRNVVLLNILTQYLGLMNCHFMTFFWTLEISWFFFICVSVKAIGDNRTFKVWAHKLLIIFPQKDSKS